MGISVNTMVDGKLLYLFLNEIEQEFANGRISDEEVDEKIKAALNVL